MRHSWTKASICSILQDLLWFCLPPCQILILQYKISLSNACSTVQSQVIYVLFCFTLLCFYYLHGQRQLQNIDQWIDTASELSIHFIFSMKSHSHGMTSYTVISRPEVIAPILLGQILPLIFPKFSHSTLKYLQQNNDGFWIFQVVCPD